VVARFTHSKKYDPNAQYDRNRQKQILEIFQPEKQTEKESNDNHDIKTAAYSACCF
jgi:hypothetical protein